MPEPHDKLGWALELASRKFLICPLPIDGKAPRQGFSWKNVRTCDTAVIKRWFDDNPNMNYGVSPGSGGVIIDLDQGKIKKDKDGNERITQGIDRYVALEAEHAEKVMGHTFTVRSPSNGIHLYLETPEEVTNHSGFPLDIDVRGGSGYVVGPGCYYDGTEKPGDMQGFYEVVDDIPFLMAPDWIVQRCRAEILNIKLPDLVELDLESNINQGKAFLTKRIPAFEGMKDGGDNWTYQTCCALCHNYALSRETALELLTEYRWTDEKGRTASWNERCEPPWDVYGSGDTLETKVANGDKYGKMRRGEMSGALMLQGLPIEMLVQAEEAAIQAVEEMDANRRRLTDHLLRGRDIFERIKPMRWVIPFWLPGAGITGIVGESGVGKSTVLLDLALTLAHDMDWHETPTRRGMTVVYTCGEDYEGASLQIRSWCKAKEIETPNASRFIFMPEVPPLANTEEVNLWIDVFKDKIGTQNVMVFIDTWQRATCGLSQNEEREMQGAINSAEAIGRAVHGPVVVAFHSPKSNRDTIAGWEGQRNTSNALWFLEKDARGVKLEARKVRGGARGNTLILEYVEYDTGLKDEYFGFALKHVVPKRLGGHRITPQGEVFKEENLDTVRHAVATVLWNLEHCRADDTSAKSQYTPKHAAERIVGSPSHNTFGKPPLVERADPWAVEQMVLLESAALKFPMSLDDMEETIRKALGQGYIFEDGRRISIQRIGHQAKIITSEGGLTTP